MIFNQIRFREPDLLYFALTGSRAYGIHTESSDHDYRGVFINTPEEIFGLSVRDSQEYMGDIVLHSLKKFVKLATGANPNILELLFLPQECILYNHPVFDKVLLNRSLFLTKRVKHTYSGYAMAQLKRDDRKSTHGTLREKYMAGQKSGAPYDSKFAGHTIRLMLNAIEILRDGTLTPKLSGENLDIVKKVRNGTFFSSAHAFRSYAEGLDAALKLYYEKTTLPNSPDIKKINKLLTECHEEYYEQRGM
jgi:predicted nucleotidyltransferase